MTVDEAIEMLDKQFKEQKVERVLFGANGGSVEVSLMEWSMNQTEARRRQMLEAKYRWASEKAKG